MKKKLFAWLLATSLYAMPASAQNATVGLNQSFIGKNAPISRTETLLNIPSLRADGYFIYEFGNGDFMKARGQIMPLQNKHFAFGVAAQHTTSGKNCFGPAVRIKGNIGKINGKAEVRYFPHTFDGYATAKAGKFLADALFLYDTRTHSGFIRPGIEYKLRDKIYTGIEAKYTGKNNYIGIRVSGRF